MPQGYTLEQLKAMDQKPRGYTLDELKAMDSSGTNAPTNTPLNAPVKAVGMSASQPSSTGGLSSDLGERGTAMKEDWQKLSSRQENPVRFGVRTVGNAIGGATDVLGAGLSAVTPDFIKKPLGEAVGAIAETAPVKAATNLYGEFKTAHPEAAKDVEAVGNIASVLPAERLLKGSAEVGKGILAERAAAQAPKLEARASEKMLDVIRPSKGEVAKFELKPGRSLKEVAVEMAKNNVVPTVENGMMNWKNGIEKMRQAIAADHPRLQELLKAQVGKTVNLGEIAGKVTKNLEKRFGNALELEDAKKFVD